MFSLRAVEVPQAFAELSIPLTRKWTGVRSDKVAILDHKLFFSEIFTSLLVLEGIVMSGCSTCFNSGAN